MGFFPPENKFPICIEESTGRTNQLRHLRVNPGPSIDHLGISSLACVVRSSLSPEKKNAQPLALVNPARSPSFFFRLVDLQILDQIKSSQLFFQKQS